MRAARKTAPLCVSLALALALAVSACGSSGGSSSSSATTAAPTGTQASSAAPAHTASAARLSILAPRSGTHTGPTLTVRVALSGAPSTAGQQFRYVLDGHVNRSGPSRLTFHDLAPGHHRLEVLTAGSAVHANATFTVRAPLAA
ncbi:MAG TPA: hypothetical protein VK272_05010, partial [Solirubrobacteraceae bacterium]|nr:hypothetical protein [Solirubrobacteraceae bacterium]